VQPGLVIDITPEKSAHVFTVLFKAGKLALITVEESGVQGVGLTGGQGMNVR
jgi:hypothetical protein